MSRKNSFILSLQKKHSAALRQDLKDAALAAQPSDTTETNVTHPAVIIPSATASNPPLEVDGTTEEKKDNEVTSPPPLKLTLPATEEKEAAPLLAAATPRAASSSPVRQTADNNDNDDDDNNNSNNDDDHQVEAVGPTPAARRWSKIRSTFKAVSAFRQPSRATAAALRLAEARQARGRSGDDGGGHHHGEEPISLPEALGGAETANEAAAQWRKLRLIARALEDFEKTSKPTRRRSFSDAADLAITRAKQNDGSSGGGGLVDGNVPQGRAEGHVSDKGADLPSPQNEKKKGEEGESADGDGDDPFRTISFPKRRNSAPDMERKKEIMSDALAHWMKEGGQSIRNRRAAAKAVENERQFRGLPWRCTVCARPHFRSVEEMQRPRCAACGSERDSSATILQRYRDSLQVGCWVEAKKVKFNEISGVLVYRGHFASDCAAFDLDCAIDAHRLSSLNGNAHQHARSGYYLARIEGIRLATSQLLEECSAAACARSRCPPREDLMSFEGICAAVCHLSQEGTWDAATMALKAAPTNRSPSPNQRQSVRRASRVSSGTINKSFDGGGGGGSESARSSLASHRRPSAVSSTSGGLDSARSSTTHGTATEGGGSLPPSRRRSSSRLSVDQLKKKKKLRKRRKRRDDGKLPFYEVIPPLPDFDFLPSADPVRSTTKKACNFSATAILAPIALVFRQRDAYPFLTVISALANTLKQLLIDESSSALPRRFTTCMFAVEHMSPCLVSGSGHPVTRPQSRTRTRMRMRKGWAMRRERMTKKTRTRTRTKMRYR